MSDSRKHLYIVAPPGVSRPQRFTEAADAQFAVTLIPPGELSQEGRAGAPARGVVILYDGEAQQAVQALKQIRANARYAELPVVALSANPTPAVRASLMGSGASAVLDAAAEPGVIFEVLENRCDLEPIMDELRDELLEPFLEATRYTLRQMLDVETTVHQLFRKQGYRIFGDYSSVVGLAAATQGIMVLSLPRESAHELGRRILAPFGVASTEELIQGSVAELANIIVGRAKGMLAETAYRFSMSTPTVVGGRHHEIRYEPGLPCLAALLSSGFGDFALHVCITF
jgi:CheY-specific phosphatase CheX